MNYLMFFICVFAAVSVVWCATTVIRKKLWKKHIANSPAYGACIVFSIIIAGALYGLWYGIIEGYSWPAGITAITLAWSCGLSISLGPHRHDTHKSYSSKWWFQFMLACLHWMGGMQKTTWVQNHRQHHAKEDTIDDPHSPWAPFCGGFLGWLWSYFGWMLIRRNLEYTGRESGICLTMQKAERLLFVPCFLSGFYVPYLFFGFEGLWLCGFIRIAYVWGHAFDVNATGHMFGVAVNKKSYSGNGGIITGFLARHAETANVKIMKVLLHILSGITLWIGACFNMVGEKNHGNHHANPRSAILGWQWYDIDSGKWVLLLLEKLGVVWDVRRPTKALTVS
jgi:stearoyl-CoA desaturase (Delta-9 desaturase)